MQGPAAAALSAEALLDVFAYLRAAACALPAAAQAGLPGSMCGRMLALHLHLLARLMPAPPVRIYLPFPFPHFTVNVLACMRPGMQTLHAVQH